jgi:predicted esterase YcpF (UPF0227 family)
MIEKKKLLYIHGFRSSARSSTILTLREVYRDVEVHAFDVTHHPVESIKKIEDYVATHGIDILAGSSLGGYYTLCARVEIPKIAVNPALNPENSMQYMPEIGHTVEYYNPREDGVQTFTCRPDDLDEFRGIEPFITPVTHIIGSDHDELLGDMRERYRALVGDRFHPSSQLGHRIEPEFLAIPSGDFYQVLKSIIDD